MAVPQPRMLAVCAVSHPGGAEIGLLRMLRRIDWDVTLTTPARGTLSDAGFEWRALPMGGLERGGGARSQRGRARDDSRTGPTSSI
jgi:hypothetical protein